MISPLRDRRDGPRMAHRYMLSGEEFDAARLPHRLHTRHRGGRRAPRSGRVMLAQLYTSGPQAVLAIKELIP